MIPKPTTVHDPKYRRSFKDKPCIVCGLPGDETGEVVGHHLGHDKHRDDHLIALCTKHHQGHPESVHAADNEAEWWGMYAEELVLMALSEMIDEPLALSNGRHWADVLPDGVMEALKLWCEREYEGEW